MHDKRAISTDNAPAAIGPYSQAIAFGPLIFTSGQIPIDPTTGTIVTADIQAQTRRSLENVKAILEAAGAGMDQVVKTTVFVKDMNDFEKINEVYAEYFPCPAPARSLVQVARLPRDVGVEIEAIAAPRPRPRLWSRAPGRRLRLRGVNSVVKDMPRQEACPDCRQRP